MSLDILVRVITNDDANEADRKIRTRNETANFLWGVVYERQVPEADGLQNRTQFRGIKKIELVFEGEISRRLYIVKNIPPEDIHRDTNFSMTAEDNRYKVFGSREIYKAFFAILNDKVKRGILTAENYMRIQQAVTNMARDAYCRIWGSEAWDSKWMPNWIKSAKAGSVSYHMERLYDIQPAGSYAEQAVALARNL